MLVHDLAVGLGNPVPTEEVADVQATTDAGAAAVLEVQDDAAEGVAEIVANEQASAVGADLN